MEDESISIYDAAKRMGKGAEYVRNAIRQGTMPGSYTVTENGVGSFHIPKQAFEDYMKYWRPVMSQDIALAIIEAIAQANAKKADTVNVD